MAHRQYTLTPNQQFKAISNTSRARDMIEHEKLRDNKWPYGEVISLLNEVINILKDDED